MKRILVTGSAGQIGSELIPELRKKYGKDNVIATDIRKDPPLSIIDGEYEILDCLDRKKIFQFVKEFKIDTIYHLAALLSGVAEAKPDLAWKINIDGLYNVLEVARELNCSVFTPSSIGAFGPTTPPDKTPQDTIQRPTSMYGVTKVSGELLCDYYFKRFKVDTRGVRYPGIISNVTLPGGGTTDYAVDIYYKAIQEGKFTCNIKKGTFMDMMYMPDAIEAAIQVMEAPAENLQHRNAFNVTAMTFDPEMIAASIKKYLPDFKMDYQIDPIKQDIAESWPNSLDDSAARKEWNWNPKYDLDAMTKDMLFVLQKRLNPES